MTVEGRKTAWRPRGITIPGGLRRVGLAVLGVGVLVGVWSLVAAGAQSVRVPSPLRVLETIRANFLALEALAFAAFGSGGLAQNTVYTVSNTLIGVAIGATFGVVVGVLVGRIQFLRDVLEKPLLFLVTVPVLVLLPFLSMWFGVSRLAINGMVIFYAFVTVAFGTQQATINVSNYFQDYARSLGATQTQILGAVITPALVPEVIGFIRGSLAFGWGLQTVAEILGGQVGVGRIIRTFLHTARTADMIGAVIVLGIVALLIDAFVASVGKWITRWQE